MKSLTSLFVLLEKKYRRSGNCPATIYRPPIREQQILIHQRRSLEGILAEVPEEGSHSSKEERQIPTAAPQKALQEGQQRPTRWTLELKVFPKYHP